MKTLFKESIVSIKKNFKRFLSILLIVLLGVGFFAGIRATSPDMKKTLDKYYYDTNFMDINILSTWGIKNEEVESLKQQGYNIETSYNFDAIVKGSEEEVIKINSYDKNSSLNKLTLLEGNFPNKKDECVIEYNEYTESHKVGETILVENDILKEQKLKIVGIIKSPIYISLERGNTKLSSGKINFFMYVPIDNFDIDYYTEAYIKLETNDSVFSNDYKELIDVETKKLKNITNNFSKARYNEEIKKAQKKVNDEETKLKNEKENYKSKILKAENQIKNGKNEYFTNLNKLNTTVKNTNIEFSNIQKQINNVHKELKNKKLELDITTQKFYLEKEKNLITLNSLKAQKVTISNLIESIKLEIISKETELNTIDTNDEQSKQKLENEMIILKQNLLQQNELLNKINQNINMINEGIKVGENKINAGYKTLDKNKNKLDENQKLLNENKKKFENKINDSKEKLSNVYSALLKKESELKKTKIDTEKKFNDAEIKIEDAKKEIDEIKQPEWYVLDRESNAGYYQYSQDTERIANIGKVFPLVFFIVAILICLTSMTRMVEEERSQLGTLKALGYNNLQILSKYVTYAFVATIIGSIIGVCIGFRVLPSVIFNMYSMMYNIGNIVLDFNWNYALLGTIIAILCTLFATIFSCIKELKETPAILMRPKSPKNGKRVLLEKITFIWKKLSFTRKVTVRNVFRYKKRFLMTIIGIAGCTGLIIAGFGLRDCITGMVPSQYEKVFNYQIEIIFKDSLSIDEKNNEIKRIKKINGVKDLLTVNKESVTIKNKNTNQAIQLVVPFSNLENFINLANRKTQKHYKLNDKVVISEKISKLLNLKVGDKLIIETNKNYDVEIGAIAENYFYHYIYMSKNTYNDNYYNTILIKTDEMSEQQEKKLAKVIKENDTISSIKFTSSMRNVFDSTMKNFGYVTGVLIVSAGLLAFVVLYNLANVNISERKRELATIKVLGFYDKEVYNYIGRETTILTIIGMIFGIIIGKILTVFIIKTCELDPIMFNTIISFNSYIYSLLITVFFTILVNVTTYFSLKKVDMIESLKSIE